MKGLYGKYIVRKRSDNSIVTNCFVLRPDRDDAAIAAMLAYADATSDSQLAQELREWAEYEQGVKPPVTNADRIRAMTDKLLLEIEKVRAEASLAITNHLIENHELREENKRLRVNAVPEHGQSLELPCKVGDRLRLEARGTCYYTVTSLLVLVTQQETRIVIDVLDDAGNSDYFFSESIGKTVFRVDRGQRQKEEV